MSEPKLPHMPLWVYDLEADEDCCLMSLAEFGAYMRLLQRQWIEGTIPDDVARLARLLRVTVDEMEAIWSTLSPKFVKDGRGRLQNRRLDAERAAAMGKVATNRANGAKGGRPPKTERFSETKPNGSIRVSGSGSGSDSPEGGSAEGGSAFDAFWAEYPRKVGKGNAARLWADLPVSPDVVMAGLARCKASAAWSKDGGQYVPKPSNWLTDEGWHDHPDPSPSRKADPLAGKSAAELDGLYALACERWPDCKAQGRGSDYTRSRMAKLAKGAA